MECFVCQEEIKPRENTVTIEVIASRLMRHAACTHSLDDKVARNLARLYGINSIQPLPDRGNHFTYIGSEEKQQRAGTPLSADDVLDIRENIRNGFNKTR